MIRHTNAVSIKDLCFNYPGQKKPALDGLSFEVGPGQVFGILGPNGGGKSTTFKLLSTLIKPSAGVAELLGVDVVKHPAKARSLFGVVFQSPALDKKLTVQENLICQGHLYGLSGRDLNQRIQFLVERMGFQDRLKDKAEILSGGLKRRLEITKCLIHTPKILLLDEPTTGLDPLARREVWSYLHFLKEKENLTILVTTHLLDEADDCDAIALIDAGRVVCTGTPKVLRQAVGADLISIRSMRAAELTQKIQARFGFFSTVLGNDIRIQKENASQWVEPLLSAFRDDIDSVTVGKPTLEDLYIQKTGRRFWTQLGETAMEEAR